MLVAASYRGRRIQVEAVPVDGRWDADVTTRRLWTDEKGKTERVTCRKPDAELAERWAMLVARRWVDLHGDA
jgi:hypothetical protein